MITLGKVESILFTFELNHKWNHACWILFYPTDAARYEFELLIDGTIVLRGLLDPLTLPTLSKARSIINTYLKRVETHRVKKNQPPEQQNKIQIKS